MTQNDVDHARHHDHNEAAEAAEAESSEAIEADGSILKLNLIGEKPTKRPHNPEEHTNVIPHIPNYWTPSDTSSIIMYSSKDFTEWNLSFCFSHLNFFILYSCYSSPLQLRYPLLHFFFELNWVQKNLS